MAARVALGAGAAAIGLVLFVVGSFVADANERRRRLLRERFVLVPLEGVGGVVFLGGRIHRLSSGRSRADARLRPRRLAGDPR